MADLISNAALNESVTRATTGSTFGEVRPANPQRPALRRPQGIPIGLDRVESLERPRWGATARFGDARAIATELKNGLAAAVFGWGWVPPQKGRNLLREALVDNTRDAQRYVLRSPTDDQQKELDAFAAHFKLYRQRYERVAKATGIPAVLVAAIHYRESSLSFDTYLHNGEDLGKKTEKVPVGIYFAKGQWEAAAIDALTRNRVGIRTTLGITRETTDIAALATFAEAYNGLGYQKNGYVSAYVWSGTDIYTRGMYVSDGSYSKTKREERPGVVALLAAVGYGRKTTAMV